MDGENKKFDLGEFFCGFGVAAGTYKAVSLIARNGTESCLNELGKSVGGGAWGGVFVLIAIPVLYGCAGYLLGRAIKSLAKG